MKKVFSYITIFVLLLAIFSPFVVYGADSGGIFSFAWNNVLSAVIVPFAYLIFQMMSGLLWLAGYLLDKIIVITILTFSKNINDIEGIRTVWVVVRDVMNIGFIFLLIFEGMKKILGLGGDAKKLVIGIILTSLLLNFSLLVTKVIIDASNIVTIGFYNSIVSGSNKDLTTTIDGNINGSGQTLSQNKGGLSSVFMNVLNITSIMSKDSINNISKNESDGGRTTLIILLLFGSLIFLIVAIAFIAVSAMFLVRYVTLIVLMVLSPIAFMGYAFPAVRKSQSDWWTTLMGQCLFGPVYMFMTWLTLVLATGIIPRTNDVAGWSKLLTGEGENIVLVINLAVVIGLVIMSISMAKKYATQGTSMLGTATNWLTAAAGGVLMGGVAMAGRNTIGRVANNIASREGLKDAAEAGGVGGWAAKMAIKGSEKTAKSTFDARQTKIMGDATKRLGVDLGKADKKNNFRENLNAKIKAEEEFAKKLKPNDATLAEASEAKQREESLKNTKTARNTVLTSKEFQAEEKARKETYLKSEEYKNSDLYKNYLKEQDENEKIIKQRKEEEDKKSILAKEMQELENKQKNPLLPNKQENAAAILKKKQEIQESEAKIKNFKENKEAEKALKQQDDTYKSEQKIKIESEIAGIDENIKIEAEKQAQINGLYEKRATGYAENVRKGNMFWNIVGNGIGYNTKTDRAAMARKIRATSKEKTKKEKAAEANAEYAKEIAKQEEEEKKTSGETGKSDAEGDKTKTNTETT